jgi:RNA recognition motif-containing protein
MSTSHATETSSRRRSGGGGQGSRNRNNNRSRSGGRPNRRPAKPPEPTFGQKLLKVVTFGLVGGTPAKPASGGSQSKSNRSGSDNNRSNSRGGNNRGRSDSSPRRQSGGRDSRSPEIIEVTSSRLYVGNLSYDATESDLFELFSGVGAVQNAEVVSHKYSQRSKGYAFVEMGTTDEAKRAVDVLHDQDFMGRKLVVSGAKSRGPHENSDRDSDSDRDSSSSSSSSSSDSDSER